MIEGISVWRQAVALFFLFSLMPPSRIANEARVYAPALLWARMAAEVELSSFFRREMQSLAETATAAQYRPGSSACIAFGRPRTTG